MNRKEYIMLLEPAMAVATKKDKDYNTVVPLEAYFPFGDLSYVQMMQVKSNRLVSLVGSGSEPNHESVRDSVLDLINYAVFYLQYLENQ